MYFTDEQIAKFQPFAIEELLEMVRTISRTKSQSREGVWKDGFGLESMDALEANVDDILLEIARRIRNAWSLDRIQYNFRFNTLNLPNELLNLYNITAAQLNFMLYKDHHAIGSVIEDGQEEIYIKQGPVKFIMKADGMIVKG